MKKKYSKRFDLYSFATTYIVLAVLASIPNAQAGPVLPTRVCVYTNLEARDIPLGGGLTDVKVKGVLKSGTGPTACPVSRVELDAIRIQGEDALRVFKRMLSIPGASLTDDEAEGGNRAVYVAMPTVARASKLGNVTGFGGFVTLLYPTHTGVPQTGIRTRIGPYEGARGIHLDYDDWASHEVVYSCLVHPTATASIDSTGNFFCTVTPPPRR